jgi:hypothetical protein
MLIPKRSNMKIEIKTKTLKQGRRGGWASLKEKGNDT